MKKDVYKTDMKIKDIINSCEIKQGWSKNERLYVFNSKVIFRFATRTKNIWLNNCIRKFSNLSEEDIEKEVKECLNAKKALFSDDTDNNLKLKNGFKKHIDFTFKTTGKLPKIDDLTFLPEPAIDVIKEIYKENY